MDAMTTDDFETDFSPAGPAPADLGPATCGLIAGTKVATRHGWRPVQAVVPGDHVLTFDHGMQRVAAVRTHLIAMPRRPDPRALPLFVPEGALGNLAACLLLPGQAVLVESDLAEDMLGDAFAAVRGGTLAGVEGIVPVLPEGPLTVVTLHFERDEVVFGAGGVLFVCAGRGDLLLETAPAYPELAPEMARMVVADGVMPAGAVSALPGLGAAA